jgi:LytS/YehU family sensor histidine kinase
VALHYVLLAFEAAREAERREAEMRLLAREAELKALKSQVQPHFLFNCLNSISALAASDPARAREMCLGLADFLRRSLAVGEKTSIRVGEELWLARSYLEVERVRFGDRLLVEEAIEPSGEECLVPPLLLQPLVENAVVHGISTLAQGGAVRLEARRTGNRLRIVIENPFDPDVPLRPPGGLGLKIVRDRLTALYGSDAIFAARRLDGNHLAVISIPART